MSYSLYDLSIGFYLRGLDGLSHVLRKAEVFAKEHNLDPNVFVDARLYPDMKPLAFQIRTVANLSVSVLRVTGAETVRFDNVEKTMDELHGQISKAVEILKSADPNVLVGIDDQIIHYPSYAPIIHLPARDYLLNVAIPNIQFHITTTYDILRHFGVPLTKKDFLTGYVSQYLQP
jgi:uncharacterized protein